MDRLTGALLCLAVVCGCGRTEELAETVDTGTGALLELPEGMEVHEDDHAFMHCTSGDADQSWLVESWEQGAHWYLRCQDMVGAQARIAEIDLWSSSGDLSAGEYEVPSADADVRFTMTPTRFLFPESGAVTVHAWDKATSHLVLEAEASLADEDAPTVLMELYISADVVVDDLR